MEAKKPKLGEVSVTGQGKTDKSCLKSESSGGSSFGSSGLALENLVKDASKSPPSVTSNSGCNSSERKGGSTVGGSDN